MQGKQRSSKPREWGIVERDSSGKLPSVKPGRPPQPPSASKPRTRRTSIKMSEELQDEEMYSDEDIYGTEDISHLMSGDEDVAEEDEEDQEPPTADAHVLAILQAERELAKKELEVLKMRGPNAFMASSSGGSAGYDRDKKRKGRARAGVKPTESGKRIWVEVDATGNPTGLHRTKFFTTLRGYSRNIDFSIDNYKLHDKAMLLDIKAQVDAITEYRGGLGRLSEEGFHKVMMDHLRMKRYHTKQIILKGGQCPPGCPPPFWQNMIKLIKEDRKKKESEARKASRSKVQKKSHAGRSEGEVRDNLVRNLCAQLSQFFKCILGLLALAGLFVFLPRKTPSSLSCLLSHVLNVTSISHEHSRKV